jgi:hypothetical protein
MYMDNKKLYDIVWKGAWKVLALLALLIVLILIITFLTR